VLRCPYSKAPGISDGVIEVLEVKMKNFYTFTEISPVYYSRVVNEV
jgi:hypothetical protein